MNESFRESPVLNLPVIKKWEDRAATLLCSINMTSNIPYHHLLESIADPSFSEHELEVFVLRTDRIHPVISGNKWMKLQPWIKKAKETLTPAIISKGGPWSNHLHATAYTAMQEGLSFTAVVKAAPGFMTATLNDLLQWKANLLYVDHEQYQDEAYWENLAFVQDAIYVPMGGEGEVAVQGVSEFLDEYADQQFDYVICPVGTATTLLGIAFSKLQYQHLIGIDPGINDKNYDEIISRLSAQFPGKSFQILADPALKKFGKWPEWLPSKMNEWYQRWQLPTDIIYTAKMMAQVEKLVASNFFGKGKRILLVHTGGLQGNRSLPAGVLTFK